MTKQTIKIKWHDSALAGYTCIPRTLKAMGRIPSLYPAWTAGGLRRPCLKKKHKNEVEIVLSVKVLSLIAVHQNQAVTVLMVSV